jgi:hypothetical protein
MSDEESLSGPTIYLIIGVGVGVAVLIICIVGLILVCRSAELDQAEEAPPAETQAPHGTPPVPIGSVPDQYMGGPAQQDQQNY